MPLKLETISLYKITRAVHFCFSLITYYSLMFPSLRFRGGESVYDCTIRSLKSCGNFKKLKQVSWLSSYRAQLILIVKRLVL